MKIFVASIPSPGHPQMITGKRGVSSLLVQRQCCRASSAISVCTMHNTDVVLLSPIASLIFLASRSADLHQP
jgi:hypothetical protein